MPGFAKSRPSSRRQQRVSDQIRAEVADMLEKQTHDPRLAGLSVTSVEIGPDLRHAVIYVSSLVGQSGSQAVLSALKHACGYFRRELARRLKLRLVPELSFQWDASLETGDRISRLLDSLEPLSPQPDDADAS